MSWLYMAAIVALLVPAAALAQTYDTPQTLAVVISPPFYTYVDADGYAVATGIVRNESETAYVGNVVIQARFYGDAASLPLDAVTAGTLLEVIPPGGSSPFVARSAEPDPRIKSAVASLQMFDPSNPKIPGLAVERLADGLLRIRDSVGAPHANITVHIAYHDAFDPPRILGTSTHHIGGMGIGGSLNLTTPGEYPLGARGATAFVESDAFSSGTISWRIGAAPSAPSPPPAQILDAWMADHTGVRTTAAAAHQNVTLNAAVHLPDGEGRYWLYVQVSSKESGGVVLLERVEVDGAPSIPWTPTHEGEYIAEMFLWGETSAPASRPGPLLLLTVG
ncbi:MAG: hypothetical protein J4G04_05165 [Nitrosopumilaceae archaeon]|nr:hypothetical protein [Nitrosopumilaceae archaeon]